LCIPVASAKVATTAETALNEVVQFQPDAILLDLRMPALSGLECLRRMRTLERARLTPVAVITGDIVFVHANREQLQELNADVYYKPVRLKDLLGITRSLLQKPS
jgi:CheY-like chemotaxis protein